MPEEHDIDLTSSSSMGGVIAPAVVLASLHTTSASCTICNQIIRKVERQFVRTVTLRGFGKQVSVLQSIF